MRSPWHKRALSCFLAFCLATALFPVTSSFAIEIRRTPNTSFKQTEAALNSFDEPKAPQEVLLREPLPKEDITEASDIKGTEVFHDRNSITYKTGQGEYTTRFFSDPLTFIDERGEEHDVDNSLVQTGDSYTNAANAYSVTLPRAGDALSIKNEGFTLKLTPLFGQLANSVVSDNTIRYNNIAEGVDLQYSV
ncbi:MAG: hypothetical protein LBU48_06625 [Coriobacteriales bacterium]|jgi:hypothetical protein|nr:hypothetical protein [Coriobacteriales bacterium]